MITSINPKEWYVENTSLITHTWMYRAFFSKSHYLFLMPLASYKLANKIFKGSSFYFYVQATNTEPLCESTWGLIFNNSQKMYVPMCSLIRQHPSVPKLLRFSVNEEIIVHETSNVPISYFITELNSAKSPICILMYHA